MSLETNVPKISRQIASNEQQTAAIAYLGQLALTNIILEDLFTDATTLIAQMLPADFTLVWELEADRAHLSLKTISGWREGTSVRAQMPLEEDSFESFILKSPHPILVSEVDKETRFKPSSFLRDYRTVSGIGLRIGTYEKPCGVIEVFSQHTETFSQGDVHFLQSIANIIGSFMVTKRKEAQWLAIDEQRRQQLTRAQTAIQSAQAEWDQYEIKSRLVESRERERLRLAQDLHDNPIQDLYGLMYQLDDLKDILKDSDGEATLEDFNRTLHRVVDNLRSICGELRPPSLAPFGLEVAIRDHIEKLRRQDPDIHVHLELMRDQQVLSNSLRLCLFRIYQQAINNVMRHAQATDVHIRFRWDENVIFLEVEDNGIGFEMPRHWVEFVRQERFGLVGLAERVESVQGKLEISSAPGDGTLIRVIVPRHYNASKQGA